MGWPETGQEPTLVDVVLAPRVALSGRAVVAGLGEELFSFVEESGHANDDVLWVEGRVGWIREEIVENSAEARAFCTLHTRETSSWGHQCVIAVWSAPRRPGTWQVLGNGFIFYHVI